MIIQCITDFKVEIFEDNEQYFIIMIRREILGIFQYGLPFIGNFDGVIKIYKNCKIQG